MRLSRGIITATVTRKSLGIPKCAGTIRNNQVRYWTAYTVNNILFDRNCASCSGCETPNFLRCALCKPDRSSCILRDTIWQASRCCNSSFDEGFGCGIEEANFACRVFGKPDITMRINEQEHGAGEPRRLQEVFHQRTVRSVILADIGRESGGTIRFGVTSWLCDPDMTTFIKSHSPWSGLRRRFNYPCGART